MRTVPYTEEQPSYGLVRTVPSIHKYLSRAAFSYLSFPFQAPQGGWRAGGLNLTALVEAYSSVEVVKAHVYIYISFMISNGRILR